jgi:hypothetical protein
MKLRDLIFFYYLNRISEIFVCLARESDNQICTDVEIDGISSFYISEFREDFSEASSIIVTIHGFQYIRRASLNREVSIGNDTRIFK